MQYKFPFIYVSGQGHGISHSSELRAGLIAEPMRKFGQAGVQTFANIFNQNLVIFDREITPYESGLPFAISAVYNSLGATPKTAWQLSVNKRLLTVPDFPNGTTATLCESDGHATTYTKSSQVGNLCWLPDTLGSGDPYMVRDETLNQWVIYYPDRKIKEYYNDTGQLEKVVNNHGASLQYHYNSDGTLSEIVGQSGTVYAFNYQTQTDGSKTIKVSMTDAQSKVSDKILIEYDFDQLGRLSASSTESGYQTLYTYFGDTAYLQKITQTDKTVINFIFDTVMQDGKISEISVGDIYHKINKSGNTANITRMGGVSDLTVVMDDSALLQSVEETRGYTVSTPGLSYQKSYEYENGRLKCITYWDNSQAHFEYSGDDIVMLSQKTFPNGRQEQYYYDNELMRFMISKVVIDENNQQYAHRFVYDYLTAGDDSKKVLRYTLSPMGCVTEYRYDENTGLLMTTRTYLESYFDLTDLAPSDSPAHQAMEAWAKKQNPSKVRLTTYAYDTHGQHKTVKHYVNVDSKGQGVDDDQVGITQTEYDQFHHLLTQDIQYDTNYMHHRSWSYDDLERQLTEKITFNTDQTVLTEHDYQDTNSQVRITYPNQKTALQTAGAYGTVSNMAYQAESNTQPQTREAKSYGDAVKRSVTNVQTDQKINYTFYDEQSHLGYSVSNTGLVKSVQPYSDTRYTVTTEYADPINVEDLFLGMPHPDPSLLPEASTLVGILGKRTPSKEDRSSYQFHGKAGELRYTVDAAGYLVEHRYNLRGLKVAAIQYAAPVTDAELASLKTSGSLTREPDPSVDRYARRFYNNDGHLIAKQDPAGYLIEYTCDVLGQVVGEIHYAKPVAFTGTFPDIRPAADPDDAHQYYFRNNRGQIILSVDAENFVTTHTYYANGLKQGETHCYQALDANWDKSKMPATPAVNSEDKQVTFGYDEFKRLVETIDPHGLSNAKQYDQMGNLLLDRDYDRAHIPDPFDSTNQKLADPDLCRTKESQFDQWGQVVRGANKRVGTLIAEIMTDPNLSPDDKSDKIAALWSGQSSRYTYDDSGLKLSATNTLNEVTQYFYDAERRLVLVIDPTGAATQHTYNAFNEKTSTRQLYQKIDLSKLPSDRADGFITEAVNALLQTDDSKDILDQYTYDLRGHLETHTDPEQYVTKYEYNAWGEVSKKHLPVKTKEPDLDVAYIYDARGNWITETKTSGTQSIKCSRTFNNCHNKMDSKTDAQTNTTHYTYDRRGDMKQLIDPAQIVQHDRTYDALHRVLTDKMPNGTETHQYDQRTLKHTILHPEAGTKTILTSNVFGQHVALQDALGEAQGYAKKWTHEAGGHIQTATNELGNTHAYVRDTEGKLLTETFPVLSYDEKQRVDQSQYNASGHLIALIQDILGLALSHGYAPNAFGFNESVTDPRNIVTENTYYRRGELKLATHDVGTDEQPGIRETEAYTYNGQKQKTGYLQGDQKTPNQYAIAFTVDGFNRNVGKTIDPKEEAPQGVTALAIEESSLLDGNGRVIRHTDPLGFYYYLFHDARGKLRFKVNADLSVFEMQYDPKGNLALRRTYDKRLAAGAVDEAKTVAEVAELVAAIASDQDTQTFHFYNANNQLQFVVSQIGDSGFIREHHYDLAGRDIGQTGYANLMKADFSKVSQADIQTWVGSADNQSPQDRYLHHVLDACGQKRFSFQADGSVLESRFDAYGHRIMQIQYAQFISDPSTYLNKRPEDIQIPDNPAEPNHITYSIFDVRNKPEFSIVGNAVIGYKHDADGNVTQECHYADTITVPDNYDDLVKLCRALVPDTSKDKVKGFTYDHLNHVVRVTDPNGHQDVYVRDALGNERQHIDRNKATWGFDYDRAKRRIAEHLPAISLPDIQWNTDTGLLEIKGYTQVRSANTKEYDNANNVTASVKNAGQPTERRADMQYSSMHRLKQLQLKNILVDDRSQNASFETLPQKTIPELNHNILTNAKGKRAATQAMNGAWEFDVYDSAERHVFKLKERKGKLYVTEYVRNAFGEQLQLIRYNNPLTIDYSQYTDTGIPLSVVTAQLQPDQDKDEVKEFVRGQRGHIQDVFESPVFWHMPDKSGPKVGIDKPHTQYRDDTRGKRILIRRQRFPGHPELDYLKRQWWDDQGNLLAEAESRQLSIVDGSYLESPVTYKVTTYQYNAKKEPMTKTEWANPISQMPDETMSYDDLQALFKPSNDDRVHAFEHDLDSNITKESLLDVTYETVSLSSGGIPEVQQQVVKEVSTEYGYSPVGLRIRETNAKGVSIYTFYDSRNKVAVKTGEPFTTQDRNGNTLLMTPLQFTYHDSFGKKVVEIMYANGANPIIDPTKAPTPREADPERDVVKISLYDNRGSVYLEQDPNGVKTAKLYDVMRNMSRHFSVLTNYVLQSTKDASGKDHVDAVKTTHIDETQNNWDDAGNLTQQDKLRDHVVMKSTLQSVNAFNAVEFTGDADDPQSAYRHYNRSGHDFSTNHNKEGVSEVTLSDLTHQASGVVTSATENISALNEADMLAIMQDPDKRAAYNITSQFRTPQGKLLREERPKVNCFDGDVAQNVQLSLSVVSDLDHKQVTISWPALQGLLSTPTLALYPGNDKSKSQTFIPTINNGLSEVVISGDQYEQLSTDLYGYTLLYQTNEDDGAKMPDIEAVGQLSIDTGNDEKSMQLVAISEAPATVHLLGNTQGLTGIDLYQGDILVGHYAVEADPKGRGFVLDLFDAKTGGGQPLPSGVYTIQAVRARDVDESMTLPVTLYTQTPSPTDQPLPRILDYSAELLVHDQLGELVIWDKLPVDYQKFSVNLSVNYLGKDNNHYTQAVTIAPGTVLPNGHYVDPDGRMMDANFQFDHPVSSITNLSVALVLDDSNTLELYNTQVPLSQELEVDSVHYFRGMQRKKNLVSVLKSRNEEDEWSLVHMPDEDWDVIPKNGLVNDPPAPTPIVTNQFAARAMSYITPLTGHAGDKPVLQYFDITRATDGDWTDITADSANALGVMIDVTGVAPAAYPWRLSGEKTATPDLLITSTSGQSFLSDSDNTVHRKSVLPTENHTLDVFDNKVATTDGEGHTTKKAFNKTDKLKEVTNPAVPVRDDEGNYHDSLVTSRKIHYDLSDKKIATTDERGKVRAIVRDEADNEVQRILPDGVIARTILSYDGFEKVLRYNDACGKLWQEFRDKKHQVIAVITPMNHETGFTPNERGEIIVQNNPDGNAKIYGYGIEKGWLNLKKMPSGQLQVMLHHRSGALKSTTFHAADSDPDPLGTLTVSHERDFFGVLLRTTLMDNSTVTYLLDLEKHTILTTSQVPEGVTRRQYRPLTTQHLTSGNQSADIWQLGALVDVPDQNLEAHWSGGVLVEQIDHAENKTSQFGYDGNLKRVLHDGETITGRHRKRIQLDARGNMQAVRDRSALLETERNATALPRRQTGKMQTPDGDTINIDQGNTFDDAGRPKIQGAPWDEDKKQPVLADNLGTEFGYDAVSGERDSEHVIRQGIDITSAITLDDDSRVDTVVESNTPGTEHSTLIDIAVKRTYTAVGLDTYTEKSTGTQKYTLERKVTLNDDQQIQEDHTAYSAGGNPIQDADTKSFNSQGAPRIENTSNTATDTQGQRNTTTTTLQNDYYGFEDQQLIAVSATTKNPDGDSKSISPANQYYNSARQMVSQTNVDTGYKGESSVDKANEVNILGEILSAAIFMNASGATPKQLFDAGHLNEKFSDPNGNLFADYMKPKDPRLGPTAYNLPQGLTIRKVPGDGNCFFYAVSLYLPQDQSAIRRLVAEHMQKYSDHFRSFYSGARWTFEEHIARIGNTNEWATALEVQALHEKLHRPIVVIRDDGSSNILKQYQGGGDPIFVYYSNNHYDALLLEENADPWTILADLERAENRNHSPVSEASAIPKEKEPDVIPKSANVQKPQFHERVRISPLHGGLSTVIRGAAPLESVTHTSNTAGNTGFQVVQQDPDVVDEPVPESFADFQKQTGEGQDEYHTNLPRPVSSFPPATQATYHPLKPMTAAEISKQVIGSDKEASMISEANGGRSLDFQYKPGFDVTIPDLQMLTFESDHSLVLSRIMALFEGSLQPHLSFAPIHRKKKHHCLEKVVHILIEVISTVVALPFKEIPILSALVAALTDMELQALAKACHLIKHFSWSEVMDSAIAAGMSAGFSEIGAAGSASSGATGAAGSAASSAAGSAAGGISIGGLITVPTTVTAVMTQAAEQAAINVSTQLANIAMGFQKKFDVRSVFDTMLVATFDAGIQKIVHLPTGAGFEDKLLRGFAHGIESLGESYLADSITGSPRELDSLLENALGTVESSILSEYTSQQNNTKKRGHNANQNRHQQRTLGHASQRHEDGIHGVDPEYKMLMYNSHGGTTGDIALPNYPDAWQQAQAEGMYALNSNSNRPVTSTNHPIQRSHYTASDSYHQAMHVVNDVVHMAHSVINSGEHLLHEAIVNQEKSMPMRATHAVNGGIKDSRVGHAHSSPGLFKHTLSTKDPRQTPLPASIKYKLDFFKKEITKPIYYFDGCYRGEMEASISGSGSATLMGKQDQELTLLIKDPELLSQKIVTAETNSISLGLDPTDPQLGATYDNLSSTLNVKPGFLHNEVKLSITDQPVSDTVSVLGRKVKVDMSLDVEIDSKLLNFPICHVIRQNLSELRQGVFGDTAATSSYGAALPLPEAPPPIFLP